MQSEKKFKTKTGFCHILPDKIILTRDGIIGNVSEITAENGISRILIIYSLISVYFLYNAFTNYQTGKVFSAIFYSLFAIFLIYGIAKSFNNSTTPIIERNKIKAVRFTNAKFGLTRSQFEMMFEDDHGKLKKRLVMLPGSLNDGQNETKKALEIMKSEGIIIS
ncbi:phosphoribosylaminoimidazolesuccinocarboxamide synthase [Flavobacterium humi]|uniref:Phosphoribosylaminoimidazolesuccinocarboxamide synthase n=2 Tax=Flavobacterium humi TaxID=2562683 RepID=A0A4Z0LAF2_9FLAO|nr:phosphoribosylaminoimidazolesuccinocarboxamide synthase [Flavobacterium humi]